MDNNLVKMQRTEFKMLEVIDRICTSNNIQYYIAFGTLLGAVRHNGFIPWDDDIDITMPRPDYDRFVQICKKELNTPYQLNTIDQMQNGFCYYYSRVEDTSIKLERNATRKKMIVPVWVDIFPIDGAPSDKVEYNRWYKDIRKWKKVFLFSQYRYLSADEENVKSSGWIKRVLRNAVYYLQLDRLINTKWAWGKLDRLTRKYDYTKCDLVTTLTGRYGAKEVFDKSVFGEGHKYVFEGKEFFGPKNADLFLSQIYGDYMTLPPEKDRKQHNVKFVD